MVQLEYSRERLDFDSWHQLARDDPDAFEALRRTYINSYISQASTDMVRTRLSRLQWRIDRERELSATPMAACIRLNAMMWDSFAGEQGLTKTLQHVSYAPSLSLNKAKVFQIKSDEWLEITLLKFILFLWY